MEQGWERDTKNAGGEYIKTRTPKYAKAGTTGYYAAKVRILFETCKKRLKI